MAWRSVLGPQSASMRRLPSGQSRALFVGLFLLPFPSLIQTVADGGGLGSLTVLMAAGLAAFASVFWFDGRSADQGELLTFPAKPVLDLPTLPAQPIADWKFDPLFSWSTADALALINDAFGDGSTQKPIERLYKAVLMAARSEYASTLIARSKNDFVYAVASDPDVLAALQASGKALDASDMIRKIVDGTYRPVKTRLDRAKRRLGFLVADD